MLDSGRPGELPLMKELIALKKARSLKDPPTGNTAGLENAPAPSNFSRGTISRSHRKPQRAHVAWGIETGKAGSGRAVVHHRSGVQVSSTNIASKDAKKFSPSPPKVLPSQGKNDGNMGWDLGLQDASLNPDIHPRQAVFGGSNRRNSPNSGDEFTRKSTGDVNDDDYSLQNWTNAKRPLEGNGYVQKREQVQNVDESTSKASDVSVVKGGVSSSDVSGSFQFRSHPGANKSAIRKGPVLKRQSNRKQSSQVLSPLTLSSHDDCLSADGQLLSHFSLEGSLLEEQEHWKLDVNADPHVAHESASRSTSPCTKDHISRLGMVSTADKTSWAPRQEQLTSSSHTSQRTLSQVSLPGNWEGSLDDELDVSELPRNVCGMPCHWSRAKRRSKCVGKNSPEQSRRKVAGRLDVSLKAQAYSGADQIQKESSKSLPAEEKETAPLLTASLKLFDNEECFLPDGCMGKHHCNDEDMGPGEPSSQAGLKSLYPDTLSEDIRDSLPLGGKELAVFVEKPRSLSEKYRPKTFEELVGQHLVAHALSNAIARGKVAPVYLFQGPRGTGKTSAARIFAAALKCTSPGRQKPCGSCTECIALASGKMSDVLEIDAASHNGLESAKSLSRITLATASTSWYKVFIIDECHMLTNETWTALLKLLEEPPRNVVVILITTDSGKLPPTAISRCQKFLFPKIKHADIVGRLQNLVKLENLDIEPGALDLIASKSDGSLRDAETVLDQLSLFGQTITLGTIHELVGSVSDDKLLSLLDLALSSDTVSTVRRARELIDSGIEPLDLMSQLATLITDILAGSYDIMNREQKKGFFPRHALSQAEMERLRIALKILSESEKQLRETSKDRTTWLTAALLRFGPDHLAKSPVSSSDVSLNQSAVSQSIQAGKKFNDWKVSSRWRGESRKTRGSKKTLPMYARRTNGFSFRKSRRPIQPGYEVQVHPTDQSSPHDASRELSTESSVTESPFSSEGHSRHAIFKSPGSLRTIWLNVLRACTSLPLRQLLQYHGKLVAMSFSAAGAVADLEFTRREHKHRAERRKKGITNAFKEVLGLHVEVKISLASQTLTGRTTHPSMGTPVIKKKFRTHTRTESDETQIDGNDPQFSPLRHWKPQNRVSFSSQKADPSSSYNFPAMPMFSKGVGMEHCSAGKGEYMGAGFRFEPGAPMHEWYKLENARTDDRSHPSLQFLRNPQQKPNFGGGLQSSQRHDFPSGTTSYARSNFNVAADGLHAQTNVQDRPTYRDSMASDSLYVDDENLRLESRIKCGGLLCCKGPRADRSKTTNQRRHRKRGILIKLVPCVRYGSPL